MYQKYTEGMSTYHVISPTSRVTAWLLFLKVYSFTHFQLIRFHESIIYNIFIHVLFFTMDDIFLIEKVREHEILYNPKLQNYCDKNICLGMLLILGLVYEIHQIFLFFFFINFVYPFSFQLFFSKSCKSRHNFQFLFTI